MRFRPTLAALAALALLYYNLPAYEDIGDDYTREEWHDAMTESLQNQFEFGAGQDYPGYNQERWESMQPMRDIIDRNWENEEFWDLVAEADRADLINGMPEG